MKKTVINLNGKQKIRRPANSWSVELWTGQLAG